MNASKIEQLIREGLPECEVRVEGDDGVHFEAVVICEAFVDKSRIARHRMVYQTLGTLMGGEIHALSLKTLAPSEVK